MIRTKTRFLYLPAPFDKDIYRTYKQNKEEEKQMSSAEGCVAEAKKEMEECGLGGITTPIDYQDWLQKYTLSSDEIEERLESRKEAKKKYGRPKVNHYQQGEIEPIDFIMSQKLNFNLGNVIKYVTRAGKKEGESKVKDLKKVIDYINFELEGE